MRSLRYYLGCSNVCAVHEEYGFLAEVFKYAVLANDLKEGYGEREFWIRQKGLRDVG